MYHISCRSLSIQKSIHCCDISRSTRTHATKAYTTHSTQRKLLDEVAKEFKITQMSDWYKVPIKVPFSFYNRLQQQSIFKTKSANKNSNLNSMAHLSDYFPLFIQNTNGSLGNSTNANHGQKYKNNSWNGQQNN